jgi:general secretion pathway protein A
LNISSTTSTLPVFFPVRLFSDDALKRIFEYSRGIPRQINRICTTALISDRLEQKQILDDSTIRKAIAELD